MSYLKNKHIPKQQFDYLRIQKCHQLEELMLFSLRLGGIHNNNINNNI